MNTQKHTVRNVILITFIALILITTGVFSFLLLTMDSRRSAQYAQLSAAATAIYMQIDSQARDAQTNGSTFPLPDGEYTVYGISLRKSILFEDVNGSSQAIRRTDITDDPSLYIAVRMKDGLPEGVWVCKKDLLHGAELRSYSADGDDCTDFFSIYGKKIIGSYP